MKVGDHPFATVQILPTPNGRFPWLIRGDGWVACGSGTTIEEAIRLARWEIAAREPQRGAPDA